MCHFLPSSPARKGLATSLISSSFLPSQLQPPPVPYLPVPPLQRPAQASRPCKSPQLNSLRLHSQTPSRRLSPLWNAETLPPRLPAPESTPCSAYKLCLGARHRFSARDFGFDFVFFRDTPPFRVSFLKRWVFRFFFVMAYSPFL